MTSHNKRAVVGAANSLSTQGIDEKLLKIVHLLARQTALDFQSDCDQHVAKGGVS